MAYLLPTLFKTILSPRNSAWMFRPQNLDLKVQTKEIVLEQSLCRSMLNGSQEGTHVSAARGSQRNLTKLHD